MRIVVQQPQFLAWVGLWNKVVNADLFVFYNGVKFDKYDHQHRVSLDGSWLTIPVEKHSRNLLIKDVKISDPDCFAKMASRLRKTMNNRRYPYFERLDPLFVWMEAPRMAPLFMAEQVCMSHMILDDILELGTRYEIDDLDRAGMGKTEKLVDLFRRWVPDEKFDYMAGAASRQYLETGMLDRARVYFQTVNSGVSPGSILQLIAQEEDPLPNIIEAANWHAA